MIIQRVNGTGIALFSEPGAKIKSIKAYVESSSVQLWIEIAERDYLAYLSPTEAMVLSRALDRLAVEALRESAETP